MPTGDCNPHRLHQYNHIDTSPPGDKLGRVPSLLTPVWVTHSQTYKYWATNTYNALYNIVKSFAKICHDALFDVLYNIDQ